MKRVDIDTHIRLQINTVHRAVRDQAAKGHKPLLNDQGVAAIEGKARELGDLLKGYYAELERIDREIQPEFRRTKSKEVSIVAGAKIQEWRKANLDPWRARINVTRGAALASFSSRNVPPPRTDLERLILELRQREIREQLKDLKPAEVELLYLQANEEIRHALESAPTCVRKVRNGMSECVAMINPDLVATTRNAQAMAEAPEVAADLECLDGIRMFYETLVNIASKAIQETNWHQSLGGNAPAGLK